MADKLTPKTFFKKEFGKDLEAIAYLLERAYFSKMTALREQLSFEVHFLLCFLIIFNNIEVYY